MGCVARLGCLLLLVLLGFAAWITRDRWTPYFGHAGPVAEAAIDWMPLTVAGAQRAQAALDSLDRSKGPVFQNVQAGDAAAYVMKALLHRDPAASDSAAAAVVGDELYVRATVKMSDLGGSDVLGSLASMLGSSERLQMAGTFHVVHPGLIEYRVVQVKIGKLTVPAAVIPKLLDRIARGAKLDGVTAGALPMATPKYLVDVRVADGHLTLYKGRP